YLLMPQNQAAWDHLLLDSTNIGEHRALFAKAQGRKRGCGERRSPAPGSIRGWGDKVWLIGATAQHRLVAPGRLVTVWPLARKLQPEIAERGHSQCPCRRSKEVKALRLGTGRPEQRFGAVQRHLGHVEFHPHQAGVGMVIDTHDG